MNPYWTLANFVIAMSLLLASPITNADEWSGHISGYLGFKTMNSSDWPDIDTHFSMGPIFDIKKDSWPISIALDLMDTGSEHERGGLKDLAHTTEYHLGVRKIFMDQDSKIQPYIGGGVSYMYAELEYQEISSTRTQDDTDLGIWIGAGMYYEMNPSFVLGLDLRYSHGEVTLFDQERKAGGIYTGVTVGYQF